MSNSSRILTNNNEIQSVIDMINALPEAAEIETCTVTIAQDYLFNAVIYYWDGNTICQYTSGSDNTSLSVMKNSFIFLHRPILESVTPNGAMKEVYRFYDFNEEWVTLFQVTEDCSITLEAG